MTETKAIPCSEAVRQLWDYLDSAISPEDQERVEKHLSFCRRCCGELEFAKELRAFLARASREDVPADVLMRLNSTLEGLQP